MHNYAFYFKFYLTLHVLQLLFLVLPVPINAHIIECTYDQRQSYDREYGSENYNKHVYCKQYIYSFM